MLPLRSISWVAWKCRMVMPAINWTTENITKIIRECCLCSVSLTNTVKEEWYARITKLRKMVDQLFCKKFGEYSIIIFFPFMALYFLKGCFHYFLCTSTWMRPLISFFKYLKSCQLSEKECITLLLIQQGKFIVKKIYKSYIYSSSNCSQFLPIWIFFLWWWIKQPVTYLCLLQYH